MLRLAHETARAGEPTRVFPKRMRASDFFSLRWLAIGRRNAKIDYTQSDSFDAVTHLNRRRRGGTQRTRQSTDLEPITDQNIGNFLKSLVIRLPQWKPRSLEEELDRYYEQQEKKRQG